MAWIGYQKAFERVPHSWMIKSLKLMGINTKVISFTKNVTGYWRRRMLLYAENKLIKTEDMKIKFGIFQGDSLPPLQFLVAYSLSLNN
jgi:hypothetical protein